ncbi:MAG: Gfo/Idh/MocA family oxidoreductase [Armatimonadetes bacterium]|nr:Gfo/Idh/MocA family oxidoreductase [Armatimonadota bacterium]
MKVGVVGTGGMGNVHARHYVNMPDVELYAYDRDLEKLGAFCKHHGAKKTDSYEDLLATCDIVDICLPTHLHKQFSLEAIDAGKAVLLEKPMARTVEECREILDAANAKGVPFSVGHVVRFFPEHEKAHQVVVSGEIGDPAAVRMRRGGRAPVGSDGWFQNPELSGGVILDLGIHELDWLRWTLGECTQVFAQSVRANFPNLDSNVQGDYALITLSFESGAIAHVEATWMDPSGFRTTLEVCGSKGLIDFDSRNAPSLRTHTDSGTRNETPNHVSTDPYYRQLRGFVDAVKNGTEPAVGGLDGLKAVAIALAAIESAQTGKPVKPATS